MINWREKFVAFGIHFMATLALGACAAALIFLVWFPDPFQTMIGGTELFVLVIGCDMALGPLLSLVIYDSRKSRGKLIFDYCVVGSVQLAALAYGVFVVAGARPVYVAFVGDRIEVVTARDIRDAELAVAAPGYHRLPFDGPRMVAVKVPAADRQDALFAALAGNEEHQRPRFFVPYETELDTIRRRAGSIDALAAKFPEAKPRLDAAATAVKVPPDRLRWLPAHHGEEFWTALIDTATGKPVGYVDFDPYGS